MWYNTGIVRGLAQLVARALWEREVSSSSLLTPTIFVYKGPSGFFFAPKSHRFSGGCWLVDFNVASVSFDFELDVRLAAIILNIYIAEICMRVSVDGARI